MTTHPIHKTLPSLLQRRGSHGGSSAGARIDGGKKSGLRIAGGGSPRLRAPYRGKYRRWTAASWPSMGENRVSLNGGLSCLHLRAGKK